MTIMSDIYFTLCAREEVVSRFCHETFGRLRDACFRMLQVVLVASGYLISLNGFRTIFLTTSKQVSRNHELATRMVCGLIDWFPDFALSSAGMRRA